MLLEQATPSNVSRAIKGPLSGRVMYQSMFGRGPRWLRDRPRVFFDWEKTEGVLTPELHDKYKHEEGTPMLLEQATPSNVSRAIKEINAFEWEGDFKPMARQALKHLVEKRLDEEIT